MDISFKNEVPMSAEELWHILHTPEFDAFMAREYELTSYRELEKKVLGNLLYRRVRIITGTDLSYIPFGLAHKILGDSEIIYEMIQNKYLDRYEMRWENKWIAPPLFKDKIQASGVLRLIPLDEDRCERIMDMGIHIRIFGLGPILEGMVAEQAKQTSKRFSQVVSKWKSVDTRSPQS